MNETAEFYPAGDGPTDEELALYRWEQEQREIREAVRRQYGDEAARLIDDGWTVDSACNHVAGICDRAICGGEH